MKKKTTKSKSKVALSTFVTMSFIILCLSVLVALFIFNKYIGFLVSFIFVIILLITAKLEAQKMEKEKQYKKVV